MALDASQSAAARRPSVGDHVPGLRLPRVDGTGDLDLATLSGRRFLLFFWASW